MPSCRPGNPPDVFRVPYYTFGRYAGSGQLLDLSSHVDKTFGNRFTPAAWAAVQNRIAEFADAVRRHRYIGACYGAPGIGRTLSARTYAAADDYGRWATDRFMRSAVLPPALMASRTAMLTPGVTNTPRDLEIQLLNRYLALKADIARTRAMLETCGSAGEDVPSR